MSSYCESAPGHPYHGPYHDREYGFPERRDAALFERLALEINQAGLSWLTVLKKRPHFQDAFQNFDIDRVAAFTDRDKERLLANAGIIRNRRKIEAVIENACRLQELRTTHGSFAGWLDSEHPMTREHWVRLFRSTFRFTGNEITGEFLMSTGYLPGAHHRQCPVYAQILRLEPPWLSPSKGTGDP
jgi:DNA-3-methyladenine glycosylase I